MAASTPAATGRIFISYRRDDTDFPAGWLYERLAGHFGADQVFKDVDSIDPGEDFTEAIAGAVGSCDVLLALIGDRWLTIADEHGRRRLDDPNDLIRLEIEAALTRDIRVIPILVGHAEMPSPEQLPDSMAALSRRHALELSPSRFSADLRKLLRVLDATLLEEQARQEAAPTTVVPDRSGDAEGPGAPQEEARPEPAAPEPGAGKPERGAAAPARPRRASTGFRALLARPRFKIEAAAVVLAAVALVAGIELVTGRQARAEVPDLAGSGAQAAAERLDRSGLAHEVRRVPSSAPKDTVVATEPPAGSSVARGALVVLYVSSGPGSTTSTSSTSLTVPDLAGEPAATAQQTLDALGLRWVVRHERSATVPEGLVIRTAPRAGAKVDSSDRVVVLVSSGLAPPTTGSHSSGSTSPPTTTEPPTTVPFTTTTFPIPDTT
jgi:hypothetical protein